jgi:uncharacterized protein YigA (DUF484 family)
MIDAQAVADYLKTHPDFFQKHSDLLLELSLPHASGKAVSLLERQMLLMRERLADREDHLEDLLDTARHNDMQLSRVRRLVLALLEADDLNDLVVTLSEQLRNSFGTSHSRLVLVDYGSADTVNTSQLVTQADNGLTALIQALLQHSRTFCGEVTAEQLEHLFEFGMVSDGSVAVIPLSQDDIKGYLLLGSENPDYFRAEMGTEFAAYVADVVARLLHHLR